MYLRPSAGCTTYLHMLVLFPKTIIVLSLAGTISILGYSPLGSTGYAGLESNLARMEGSIEINISQVQLNELYSMARLSDTNIRYILDQCQCDDYESGNVRKNAELLDSITKIYVLDLLSRYKDPAVVRNMIAAGRVP
jgi:hypothetical protein